VTDDVKGQTDRVRLTQYLENGWRQRLWLVPKYYQLEMAYGVSNGHMTDDVT